MSIKEKIPFELKYKFLFYQAKFKSCDFFNQIKLDESRKKAFFFLAADYGNLGDVAITYAQTKFLESHGYQVVEVPISKTAEGIWWVKNNIQNDDIVTLVGGGNMGDLYEQIEILRQLVIQQFPCNKIISFPQTFDFSNSLNGQKQLSKAKRAYRSHNNLIIVAREQVSYQLMKENFSQNKVIITPDIVMTLENIAKVILRKGVVVCLRNDKEKFIDDSTTQLLLGCLKQAFNQDIIYRDTHIDENNLSPNVRIKALNDIWKTFNQAELVVTDRLHGMIFAYITNTPCIVFQNNNHKIKGIYDWIRYQPSMYLVEKFDANQIETMVQRIKSSKFCAKDIAQQFNPLIEEL